MTRRQREILLMMQELECRDGIVGVRRLAVAAQQAPSSVHRFVSVLIELGHIERRGRKYAVIRPVAPIIEYQVWDDRQKKLVEYRS